MQYLHNTDAEVLVIFWRASYRPMNKHISSRVRKHYQKLTDQGKIVLYYMPGMDHYWAWGQWGKHPTFSSTADMMQFYRDFTMEIKP